MVCPAVYDNKESDAQNGEIITVKITAVRRRCRCTNKYPS